MHSPAKLKLLFNRVVSVSLGILLQLFVIISGVSWLREYTQWMNAFLSLVSWVTVIFIISSARTNPSYKIAWIVLILAFPVAGITIYLLLGGNKTSSYENRKMQKINAATVSYLPQEEHVMEELAAHGAARNHARYLLHASHYPIYDDSSAVYYPNGESTYAAMLEALETAEHYIFLEYFIIDRGVMWDSILDILRRKAAQGVEVRVLYDDFGCITRLPGRYCRELRQMGIQAHVFAPYLPVISGRLNNRDHRKLMIIDGKIAFTGGVNLSDEYINIEGSKNLNHWKDCGIRVCGSAAWSMTVMFLTMWDYVDRLDEELNSFRPLPQQTPINETGGWVQPFCDSPLDDEDVGATAFQMLISSAAEKIWIMTPYLILDDKMTTALCVAAKTGVDVRIITPGTPDKWYVHAVTRANYEVLTEAGVRIFEYRPGFIHSKVCLSDDRYAIVGTVNMDFRSLYLHFEDAVYLAENGAVAQVAEDFAQTFPECREITYARCKHVHLFQRLGRTLLRVFSPLM